MYEKKYILFYILRLVLRKKVYMDEKRTLKTYKITQSDYNRAMEKAGKDKLSLATLLEQFAIQYGRGEIAVTRAAGEPIKIISL